LHDSGAIAPRGNDGGLSHRAVQNYWMFALCSYRTKYELCQGFRNAARTPGRAQSQPIPVLLAPWRWRISRRIARQFSASAKRSSMPEADREGERYAVDQPQQTPGFYLKGTP